MSKPPQVTVKPVSTKPQEPLTINEKLAKAMAGKEPTRATPKSESFHVVQKTTVATLPPRLNTTQFKSGLSDRLREAMGSTAKKIEFRRLPLKPPTVVEMPAMEIKGAIKPREKR